MFTSRDVLFNEASMPGVQKEQKENGEVYVEFQSQEPGGEDSDVEESSGENAQ